MKERNERVDLTKEYTVTSASTDTISQLTQDLAFLRKKFNESIQITNTKNDDKNTEFIEKISEIQKKTYFSTEELSLFIKGTLTKQDTVIKSLKDGQLSNGPKNVYSYRQRAESNGRNELNTR